VSCHWHRTLHYLTDTSNWKVWKKEVNFQNCVIRSLLHAFVMKCCVYYIVLCLLHCSLLIIFLLLTFFTYMHASSARLYKAQLFTHCLPTIICVMLMFVMYLLACALRFKQKTQGNFMKTKTVIARCLENFCNKILLKL